MCKGLIGKKIRMISMFSFEGEYIPVTVVQAGPCIVTQIKTKKTDGYNALQLGFEEKRKNLSISKSLKGHFNKSGNSCFNILREVSVDKPDEYRLGQAVSVDLFNIGEKLEVTGITKGRGFAGVIKRHGFHGGKKTHGSHSHRIPGSIGCSAWPAKVIKGKRMPGQYGNKRKTVTNLEVVDIRSEENLMIIKGAIPGCNRGTVIIKKFTSTK
jgi:large subunit ribosomal protein L3